MLLLLIGASWLFVLSLVLGLCVSARDGDLQQDLSRSAAVKQPVRPGYGATTLRVTRRMCHGRRCPNQNGPHSRPPHSDLLRDRR
jgi:hypothetical protein